MPELKLKNYPNKRKSASSKRLDDIAQEIRSHFLIKDKVREKTLQLCREVIRYSANSIHAVHQQNMAEAKKFLNSARKVIRQINLIVEKHPDFVAAGFIHDAQKEFAEANITFALVRGKPPPEPGDLKISYPAYLNGLGETIGELRRYLLDSLRRDELIRCEELLAKMDEIYGVLVTMDFSEAITYGLRRTTDVARGVLEKTRADLTLILRQRQLEEKLATFGSEIDKKIQGSNQKS